jgi:hypothetical protein
VEPPASAGAGTTDLQYAEGFCLSAGGFLDAAPSIAMTIARIKADTRRAALEDARDWLMQDQHKKSGMSMREIADLFWKEKAEGRDG